LYYLDGIIATKNLPVNISGVLGRAPELVQYALALLRVILFVAMQAAKALAV